MEMVERLPFGMRTPVAVTYVRCALCGAFAELLLGGNRLDHALAAPGITSNARGSLLPALGAVTLTWHTRASCRAKVARSCMILPLASTSRRIRAPMGTCPGSPGQHPYYRHEEGRRS